MQAGMNRFHFFDNRSFRYDNEEEKKKNETIVLENDPFLNRFLKIPFYKVCRFVSDRYRRPFHKNR